MPKANRQGVRINLTKLNNSTSYNKLILVNKDKDLPVVAILQVKENIHTHKYVLSLEI